MVLDLSEHALGLITEKMRHVHHLLNDYDPNLSLRRIPDGDPILPWAAAQTPPRLYGVYELNVGRSGENHGGVISNWVLTVPEEQIDERLFARVLEGDMRANGAEERVAKLKAHDAATRLSQQRAFIERLEERREEMEAVGRIAAGKATMRHRIRGEDYILGDTLRPVRTQIS